MKPQPWIFPSFIDPLKYEACVYKITSPNGRMYIGVKLFWFQRGGKRVESDWKTYMGSSEELLDEIAQGDISRYKREIIRFVTDRRDALYYEEMEQFAHNVIKAVLPDGRRAFYNNSIGRRYYAARGAFHDIKRAYRLEPLKCECSMVVPFAKRHTAYCSTRCLKQSQESLNEKPEAPSKRSRTKAGPRKVSRGKTGPDPSAPI